MAISGTAPSPHPRVQRQIAGGTWTETAYTDSAGSYRMELRSPPIGSVSRSAIINRARVVLKHSISGITYSFEGEGGSSEFVMRARVPTADQGKMAALRDVAEALATNVQLCISDSGSGGALRRIVGAVEVAPRRADTQAHGHTPQLQGSGDRPQVAAARPPRLDTDFNKLEITKMGDYHGWTEIARRDPSTLRAEYSLRRLATGAEFEQMVERGLRYLVGVPREMAVRIGVRQWTTSSRKTRLGILLIRGFMPEDRGGQEDDIVRRTADWINLGHPPKACDIKTRREYQPAQR